MAFSLEGKECTNCARLFKQASENNDIRKANEYVFPGHYHKVSQINEGFSYKKAIVGSLVLGAVGAVAGINGNKTATYVCDKCGHTVTQKE